MNVKRGVKSIVVKAAASGAGSSPFIAKRLLGGINLKFDPSSVGERPQGPIASVVTVDFDVTQPARYDANRAGTLALLEVAEKHGIPLTWAVCGEAAERDAKAYGAILDSLPRHELAVHTYSHLDARASTREQFRDDISRCLTTLGLARARSFAFPWNREAHFDVLREFGFRAYRGKSRALGRPVLNEGLWNVRPVYYVDQKSQGGESLMKSYVDLCVRRGGTFHLWTHPWGLVVGGDTKPMMLTLDALFARIAELRLEGYLSTVTMGDLAATMDLEHGERGGEPMQVRAGLSAD